MKEAANLFFRDLHKNYFKRRGFKKTRNRFRRERDRVIELVDFQGSAFNSRGEPWNFYVNIGLGFVDLPLTTGVGLHREAYGIGRIEQLVEAAPSKFSYHESARDDLLETLPSLIDSALEGLGSYEAEVYKRALNGHRSPIPIPNTWKSS